eukprot:g2348.t1
MMRSIAMTMTLFLVYALSTTEAVPSRERTARFRSAELVINDGHNGATTVSKKPKCGVLQFPVPGVVNRGKGCEYDDVEAHDSTKLLTCPEGDRECREGCDAWFILEKGIIDDGKEIHKASDENLKRVFVVTCDPSTEFDCVTFQLPPGTLIDFKEGAYDPSVGNRVDRIGKLRKTKEETETLSVKTCEHFPPSWGGSGSVAEAYLRNEDPYLYFDRRGNWHLLGHRYDYRDGYPANPNETLPILVSGHAYSADGLSWHFNSAQQPFDAALRFENGTTQLFSTFERPHFVFGGHDGRTPTHLVVAAQPYYESPTTGNACEGCESRIGSNSSCVVCKTTSGIDFTEVLDFLDRTREQDESLESFDGVMRKFFDDKDDEISFEKFKRVCTSIAEERDPQIWPIAGTMLIAGTAVGVILPVMPLLVKELGITQAQFGIVVAAFGFSKLFANIPAGMLTDSIGRRPIMVGGLSLISLGMMGFGIADSFSHLVIARLLSGVGVSFLIAGATMAVTDISTTLNRVRMLAPMTASFSAGAIVGPGLGGLLASSQGTSATFLCVGGIFCINAIYTQMFIRETAAAVRHAEDDTRGATQTIVEEIRGWGPILQQPRVRTLMFMNLFYWAATAGAQMTLLPLMLASEKFDLDPSMIGAAFAIQSIVSVACAAPVASIADKIGPNKVIAPGMAITGSAMAALPFTETVPTAFAVLGIWALGSSMLGSAPTAYAANLSTESNRTQVLALLRTMGDVGLLVGSSSVGLAAGYVGNDLAMQGTASFVALATGWFVLQQRHHIKKV